MSHVGATGFTRFTDPSTTPKVWDDVLIVPEMYGVRALSSALGTPRWPSGNDDDNGTLFADPPAPGAAQFPVSPVGGFATQVVHGRCSALIAAPVSLAPETRTSLPPSRLVCLDLNAQGRLAWVASSDEFSEFPDGRFSGPPLMSGASVYVPVRWGEPLNEIGVACFNATTGALRWHQRVCTGFNSGEAPQRPPVLDALAVGAGSVFLLPAEGLVAAVDAETGALQWAATGPAPQRTEPAVPDGAPELVCHGGRVFARPRDSHQLLALAADDGRQLWSLDPPTRIRDLLGVADGRLIAGGDHLWGIDVATGHAWRFGFDDPEGYGYGRGTIAGGRIYWPTHDELFVVDALAGQLVDRILLSPATGITGGNLTVAGRRLIIAAPNRLSAIGPAAWD